MTKPRRTEELLRIWKNHTPIAVLGDFVWELIAVLEREKERADDNEKMLDAWRDSALKTGIERDNALAAVARWQEICQLANDRLTRRFEIERDRANRLEQRLADLKP
jgi:hypothetical protein